MYFIFSLLRRLPCITLQVRENLQYLFLIHLGFVKMSYMLQTARFLHYQGRTGFQMNFKIHKLAGGLSNLFNF